MDLAGQVMARPEYKDAPRVFVIVDNGSDHRGQAAIRRLAAACPNAIMIHTPVHASSLNQIEIFFFVTPHEPARVRRSWPAGPLAPARSGLASRPARGSSPLLATGAEKNDVEAA